MLHDLRLGQLILILQVDQLVASLPVLHRSVQLLNSLFIVLIWLHKLGKGEHSLTVGGPLEQILPIVKHEQVWIVLVAIHTQNGIRN